MQFFKGARIEESPCEKKKKKKKDMMKIVVVQNGHSIQYY
jgi:hypothetical protein